MTLESGDMFGKSVNSVARMFDLLSQVQGHVQSHVQCQGVPQDVWECHWVWVGHCPR